MREMIARPLTFPLLKYKSPSFPPMIVHGRAPAPASR